MNAHVGNLTIREQTMDTRVTTTIGTIVSAVLVPVAVILLCFVVLIVVIVLVFRRKYKAKTMEHEKLTAEMSELKSSSVHEAPGKFGWLITF